jgi:hypothetical protein
MKSGVDYYEFTIIKNPKNLQIKRLGFFKVVPLGIEPSTY